MLPLMEGYFRTWRRTRYCALWALPLLGVPRALARHLVQHYLALERAYCWLCLHEFPVNVWRGAHALVYLSGHVGKPLCGLDCIFLETSSFGSQLARPDFLGWHEGYYADEELLRGYDFMLPVGFGTYTTAQRAALKLAVQRKKAISDAARAAMRIEQRYIKAERKQGKRDARKASACRGGERGK